MDALCRLGPWLIGGVAIYDGYIQLAVRNRPERTYTARWLQNPMKGLHRLARLICEIHVRPLVSVEIRQNVPAKLSTLLSNGTDFYACKEPRNRAVLLRYSLLFMITRRLVIHRRLELVEGEANIELH